MTLTTTQRKTIDQALNVVMSSTEYRLGVPWYEALSTALRALLDEPQEVVENNYRSLKTELDEQCRLNGMGSEREARLMAQVDELARERAYWKRTAEIFEHPHGTLQQVQAQLASVTKERAEFIRAIADHVTVRGELTQQRDELVEALEEYVNADLDDACLNSRKRFAKEALAKVGAGKTGE